MNNQTQTKTQEEFKYRILSIDPEQHLHSQIVTCTRAGLDEKEYTMEQQGWKIVQVDRIC